MTPEEIDKKVKEANESITEAQRRNLIDALKAIDKAMK